LKAGGELVCLLKLNAFYRATVVHMRIGDAKIDKFKVVSNHCVVDIHFVGSVLLVDWVLVAVFGFKLGVVCNKRIVAFAMVDLFS